MIELTSKSIAAIDALDPIESRRFTQLERQCHLDRDRRGPSFDVAEVLAVVEHAVQERILRDLLGDRRSDRAHPGDLAVLALLYISPSALGDPVAHKHYELRPPGARLAATGE